MRLYQIAIAAIVGSSALMEVQAFVPSFERVLSNKNMKASTRKNHFHTSEQSYNTASLCSSIVLSALTDTEVENDTKFENDGSFSWMIPFLGIIGYTEGKSSVYAIPMANTNAFTLNEEEIVKRQKEAAENMNNISPEERERRAQAAEICRYGTIAYAIMVSMVLDQGDALGHLVRFGIVLPAFFSIGFQKSADLGL